MTAVWRRARADFRARFGSMVALTLLVGLGAATVMTFAAGARRTDSAYPRFTRAYRAADLIIPDFPQQFGSTFADLDFTQVARLPQVAAAGVQHFLAVSNPVQSVVSEDVPAGVTVDRFKILEGRTPTSNDEAMIGFDYARRSHLHVGSRLTLQFAVTFTRFIPVTVRVVGIEASAGEFPPQISNNNPGVGSPIHISPALARSLIAKGVFTFPSQLVRLRNGAKDSKTFNDELNALAQGKPQVSQNEDAQAVNVQRSIHLQAVALWIVGALVGLIVLLIFSQLLARQATLDATDSATLRALGMTRSQVWLAGMGRMAAIGMAGGLIGMLGAFVASPLMPIGVARVAEPSSGLSFDVFILGLIACGVVVMVLALSAWPVWKSTRGIARDVAHSERPSVVSRAAAALSFRPSVSTGIRLALEPGRGSTEVPVRSSLLSVVLAIVALTGALTFGASLNHLLATPRLYGWNWDVHVTTNDANDNDAALKLLLADPRIEDVANDDTPPVVLNNKFHFDLLGLDQKKGTILPVVVDGHAPVNAGEIALGVRTIKEAHLHIGSLVTMYISAIKPVPAQFRVVGTVVIPPTSDTARLGEGAVTAGGATPRMAPPHFQIPPQTDLFLNFAPGVNKRQAEADLTKTFGDQYTLLYAQRPTDLVNFGQVQNLPLLLAALVALLAAATLAHTLATSIRRRRRDLAILKMLGFVPPQVRATVAWQATTFVSTALLIGIPVGIVAGRLVWTGFANILGAVSEPITPSIRLALTVASAIVLANVIAVIPAFVAGRMRPAAALREE